MSAGTLIFLLLIGGSLIAMFAMHRGSRSHGMGMGMGCGGHAHGEADGHRHSGEQYEGGDEGATRPTSDRSHRNEQGRASRHRAC